MQISLAQLTQAIRLAQAQRLWKPGRAEWHLHKRKSRNHLPPEATLADYEQIIQSILDDNTAKVYIYQESDEPYIAVSSLNQEQLWLVIFDRNGILETAFVVKNPTSYLGKPEFTFVDMLSNLL